jgi:NAD-dependent DNA ligase
LKKNDSFVNNDGYHQFKLLTPGVDGAIEDRLKEKRFVVTGVFPELGGGFGLNLGRDRLKAMIESFDGKVTSSISGKTDYVIVGDEPGEKRLEEARSKRKPILNRSTLHKILIGESQLPLSAESDSQPITDETYEV